MVSIQYVREKALSFPETDEHPHFERQAFRVNEKIFATLLERNQTINVKLSLIDQSVFCRIDQGMIYPVPNKWGLKGMTTIELRKASKSIVKDALTCAYDNVARKAFTAKGRK
ncbi:MAG TPA: MmcQ/YjbR family DNA-binding protein [Puia sp.]|nr:MmcQ/YjbR family DNA-binding protein [Puia sp.]